MPSVSKALGCCEERCVFMQLAAAVGALTHSPLCAFLLQTKRTASLPPFSLHFHCIFPMEAPSSNVPHYLKTKVHTTSTKPLVVLSAPAPSSGLPSALLEPGVARLEKSNGNIHSQSDRHVSYPNPVLRTGQHGQYSRDSTGHLRGPPATLGLRVV